MAEKIKTEEINSQALDNTLQSSETKGSECQSSENDSKSFANKFETLESKLRRFKKQSSGIISEVRKREAYDKPSVRRKKKSKEARRHKNKIRYLNSRW